MYVDESLQNPEIAEHYQNLMDVLTDVVVPLYEGKSVKQGTLDIVHPMLNILIEYWLVSIGWSTQGKLSELMPSISRDNGTVDFYYKLKDGRFLAVEVQFGNGGRRERDFDKLKEFDQAGLLAMGFLVYFTQSTANFADSGLATYEAALRILHKIPKFPLCVIGLKRDGSESANLQLLPNIIYPTMLGGSGETKPLRMHVAQAMVDRTPLDTLTFSALHLNSLRDHAIQHTQTAVEVFADVVTRVLACKNHALRLELLSVLVPYFKECTRLIQAATLAEEAALKSATPRRKRIPSLALSLSEQSPTIAARPAAKTVPGQVPESTVLGLPAAPATPTERRVPLQASAILGNPCCKGRRVPRAEVAQEKAAGPGCSVKRATNFPQKLYHPAHVSSMSQAFKEVFTLAQGCATAG